MSEFTRKPNAENIFENNDVKEISLRYDKQNWETRYNRNSDNSLSFSKLQEILEVENKCYWQKYKIEERLNNRTGKIEKKESHILILPISNERAIWARLSLSQRKINEFDKEYSYFIVKLKEIPFFRSPSNNVVETTNKFKLLDLNDEGSVSNNEEFKRLYQKIKSLELPTKDINKEADKKIWDNYVVALKKIIKKREQVWKIKNVSEPYKKGSGNKQNAFIDIEINENELIKQFEENIIDEIGKKKLEDWGVNKSNAFFELRNYSLLSNITLENIKSIGNEFFYELDEDSPIHYIRGEINFKYSDEELRTEIYENIEDKLAEFQIEKTFDESGEINISESDYKFLEKIVIDNYSDILEIKKDTEIKTKISFNDKFKIIELKNSIREKLEDKGFDPFRFDVSYDKTSSFITVTINTYLKEDIFNHINLPLQKITYKVKPRNIKELKK